MLTEIETGFVGSDGGEGDFCYSKECSGQLIWYKEGYDIYGGAIMTQSPGAFLFFGLKDYKPWYGPVFWFLKPCDENTYTAPASASLSAAVYATEAKCWLGYDEDIHLQYPYLTWPDIDALSRRIPYDGESPYDYYLPPVEEAPLLGDVEEAIKDEVNGDEKIQESDRHEKHPERFPDPVIPKTATKVDHSCDRTPGPNYENPFGGGEPFDRKKETPFYVKNREGFEDAVYLHWGQTRWEPALEGWSGERRNIDEWDGFGYRHIVAKHGWGSLDLTETEEALAKATPTEGGVPDEWVYDWPVSGSCTRRVVVDFEPGKIGEIEDPEGRGIVTSFNFP